MLAIAIQAGMTVDDLEQAELAYAPQFGAAKDPVNMAGFVAAGMLRGDQPTIDVETLAAEPGIALVDVRSPEEHATGTIPGARNIPLERLRAAGGELDPRRPLVVFC